MPLYEYRCKKCDATFELLLYGGDEARCPSCASQDLVRLLSVTAVGKGKDAAAAAGPCGSCSEAPGCGFKN